MKIGILLIGLIAGIVLVSGCTSEPTNGNNTTKQSDTNISSTQNQYFEVLGSAQRDGDVEVKVPVRKVTNQSIYFYYTPYVNGTPETGTWANVPQGIDTSKKFMLSLYGPDMSKYDSADILACQDENGNIVLQKEHITF